MDSDSNSDDLTSAENFSTQSNKSCPICKMNFEILDTDPSLCYICNHKVCETCSIPSDNSLKRQCNKCTKYVSYLSSSTLQQLQAESLTNKELTSKLMAIQKEVQEGRNKLREVQEEINKSEERKLVIQTLTDEIAKNQEKINNFASELRNLQSEKDMLETISIEKDREIEVLCGEVKKIKAELLECKKNSNFVPVDCGELYLENEELKEKIKEMESEHIVYTQQMIEALEMLKMQLQSERSENSGLKTIIEASNERNLAEALENEKNRIKELQEELKISKKQIDLMRASRIETNGFEPLNTENQDDPEGTPCKCTLF